MNGLESKHPQPKLWRRWSIAVAALIGAALFTGALTGKAEANNYPVYSCKAGVAEGFNPQSLNLAWTVDNSHDGSVYMAYDHCGAGMGIRSGSANSITAPGNAHSDLRFDAPPGTSIESMDVWRSAWNYGKTESGGTWRSYISLLDGAGDLIGEVWDGRLTDRQEVATGIGADKKYSLDLSHRLPTTVIYRLGCGYQGGCPTAGSKPHLPGTPTPEDSHLFIDGTKVLLRDDSKPTLTVDHVGLLGGGVQNGKRRVRLSATDNSGIKKVGVYVDDVAQPIAAEDLTLDPEHCRWYEKSPCHNLDGAELVVNTANISDGAHEIAVEVQDAAGNIKRQVHTEFVVIKNKPDPVPPSEEHPASPTDNSTIGPKPAPPVEPGNDKGGNRPGIPPVTGATSGTALSVGQPGLTSVGMGPIALIANGSGATSNADLAVWFDRESGHRLQSHRSSRTSQGTVDSGHSISVYGSLTNHSSGAPIANATIYVFERINRFGEAQKAVGTVNTDENGRFAYNAMGNKPSRQLAFKYRQHLADASGVQAHTDASGEVELDVRANARLNVQPKRVWAGQRFTYSGKVFTTGTHDKRKLIVLQGKDGRKWLTFRAMRTRTDGTFRGSYTYGRRSSRGRSAYYRKPIRLRAIVPKESGYPYAAGKSNTQRVQVYF